MSMYRRGDGLNWPSLFLAEKDKKQMLKMLKEQPNTYDRQLLAWKMLERSFINREYRANDPCVQTACERVALKFMLQDSDFAKDFLSSEELSKANEVYARKQYNSKLLQKLLQDFLTLLKQPDLNDMLENLFTLSILDEIRVVEEEEINRSYGILKKTIEKVASGVKNCCYYVAVDSFGGFYQPLSDEVNACFIKKVNYDFKKAHDRRANNEMSTLFCNCENKECNRILQLALVNDVYFWENHENFSVVVFLNEIEKQNDIRHAQKVVAFIIDNLKKMPNMELVFSHNFPLYMSMYDELVESLEDQAFRFSFKRLETYCDLSPIKDMCLCYPMCKVDSKTLEIGKSVWEQFICEYNYPNDFEKVKAYLEKEVNRFVDEQTKEHNDIAVILDCAPFRYAADNEDRRLFTAYHPDCFSAQNIWNRVYLKAYAVTLLSTDTQMQFSYLQRIFVDLIKTIEKRIGVCTAHQLDTTTRDKHYEDLKSKLNGYGIQVNDEHKNDYVISLLDRDTALIEEAEAFPILEQIGDAIYGLAVAELLFYNPKTERMAEKFERFTCAESQVVVSKKHGFDKLYLQIGLPAKYIEFDSLFFDYETMENEQLQSLNQKKYLADSLEMIVGSIYRDAGIEQAVEFVKRLLLDTFPKNFCEEVRPTEENKHNSDIDMDYWSRILPSPCAIMNDELRTLWRALDKVILIASLGTDEKEKRRFITNSFGNTAIYGESHNYGATWVFHDYLNNGIISVIQKYGEIIRTNYQDNIKY